MSATLLMLIIMPTGGVSGQNGIAIDNKGFGIKVSLFSKCYTEMCANNLPRREDIFYPILKNKQKNPINNKDCYGRKTTSFFSRIMAGCLEKREKSTLKARKLIQFKLLTNHTRAFAANEKQEQT